MGILLSKLFKNLFNSKVEYKILILGLANAGKTTLLYQLHLGQYIQSQPTIGCNIETINVKNVQIIAYDIGGQESLRGVWPSYFENVNGIIYMIDASEKQDRYIQVAREELCKLIEHPDLQNASFLILANKTDLQEAMNIEQITTILNIQSQLQPFHFQMCSAKSNTNVQQAFDWLIDSILNKSL